MFLHTIPVGVFQCNCTVLACEATRKAIVVDPGDEPKKILGIIRSNALAITAVIHTHAHIDHIMGAFEVVEATGAGARLHSGDFRLWESVPWVAKRFCIPAPPVPALGDPIEDGETIHFGNERMRVIHTPGHTSGSCCFAVHSSDCGEILLSGDTLFRGTIGISRERRSIAHSGKPQNFKTIITSIRRRILTLDDDTRVIPGHGPETRIGLERRTNPFLTG